MKNNFSFCHYLLAGLLLASQVCQAQKEVVNGISVSDVNTPTGPRKATDTPVSVKNIKFGVGIGPSVNLQPTYSYTLLAPDYALSMDNLSRMAGVVSGVVMYNKTVFYQESADSEPYASSYPLSALLAVNLVSYASNATGTATGFNSRLDLGLGLGFRFGDHFQLGLFVDLASQRFLRESYKQYLGKPVPDYKPSQNLTALDLTDDHYFVSRTVPSFSFKLIYTITANQPTKQEEQAAAALIGPPTTNVPAKTPPTAPDSAPVAAPTPPTPR